MTPLSFGSTRRVFLLSGALYFTVLKAASEEQPAGVEKWSSDQLLEPEKLADDLKRGVPVQIICVTFPILYRQKHIPNAVLAGPGNKPEGLAELQKVTAKLDKKTPLVLYCGCCPMVKCPNVGPAYRAAKADGFKDVKILRLETNFHSDWVAKGYPVTA